MQDTDAVLDSTIYSLTPGTIYKFKYRAINEFGSSDFSDELDAAVADFPAKPTTLAKVSTESGETFITL